MINKFISFVKNNNIAIKNSKILLAISGGVDSMVLAHILRELNVDFGLAHCNFNLRGKESHQDVQFIKKIADKLNTKLYIKSFNTSNIAKLTGVSIQMAARDIRYKWLEKIRKKKFYNLICTAHHKGDVAETILFNLSKGTGLEGLHGINTQHNKIIRPMLFAGKKEIIAFAKKNNINWREDSSNISVKYSRNKIRHRVIPILEEINPKVQQSIYTTSKRIKEVEKFLDFSYQSVFKKLAINKKNSVFINIKKLLAISGSTYVLYKILKPYKFNYKQTESILAAFNSISGKLFYSANHVVNIDRETLIISPITKKNEPTIWINDCEANIVIENCEATIKLIKKTDYTIKKEKQTLALDKAKLNFPLKIRNWKFGDVFYPLGMKGKKKLSDYMIDVKIPVNMKSAIKVVLSNNQIVGILNHRLDRRFKIDETTKTVFEITCK